MHHNFLCVSYLSATGNVKKKIIRSQALGKTSWAILRYSRFVRVSEKQDRGALLDVDCSSFTFILRLKYYYTSLLMQNPFQYIKQTLTSWSVNLEMQSGHIIPITQVNCTFSDALSEMLMQNCTQCVPHSWLRVINHTSSQFCI